MYFALCLSISIGTPNEDVKFNFLPPAKLLQEIFLKIKLRKFLQKCSTLEKFIISTPACGENPQIVTVKVSTFNIVADLQPATSQNKLCHRYVSMVNHRFITELDDHSLHVMYF